MPDNTMKCTPFLWRKEADDAIYYLHWCEGCGHGHAYRIKAKSGPSWTFNGDLEKPAFSPSMRVYIPARKEGMKHEPERTICHYFLENGMIRYLPDCEHGLAGKTLPLKEIPEGYGF